MGALHPMQFPFTPTAAWLQVCEGAGSTGQSPSTLFLGEDAAGNQAVSSPDLPPIGPEEPLPLSSGVTWAQSPALAPMMGTRTIWRPGEGQFCWTRCRDAEQWIVKGVVPIQDAPELFLLLGTQAI